MKRDAPFTCSAKTPSAVRTAINRLPADTSTSAGRASSDEANPIASTAIPASRIRLRHNPS
jgi:hypothetical protein